MNVKKNKAHDKVNRRRTFEQLVNMGIQDRMLKTIKKLVKDRLIKVRVGRITSKRRQTDLKVPREGVPNVTSFGCNKWHFERIRKA